MSPTGSSGGNRVVGGVWRDSANWWDCLFEACGVEECGSTGEGSRLRGEVMRASS